MHLGNEILVKNPPDTAEHAEIRTGKLKFDGVFAVLDDEQVSQLAAPDDQARVDARFAAEFDFASVEKCAQSDGFVELERGKLGHEGSGDVSDVFHDETMMGKAFRR